MAQDESPTRPDLSRTSSRHTPEQENADIHHRPSSATFKGHKRGTESSDLNEYSPLLLPTQVENLRGSEDDDTPTGLLDWNDGEDEKSKSGFYLFILTLSIGG